MVRINQLTYVPEKIVAEFNEIALRSSPTECWFWFAKKPLYDGRTRIKTLIRFDEKNYRASRIAWFITHGPIPDGLFVCHICDVPTCCNPEHLFLGTPKENSQDMVAKGRCRGPGKRWRTRIEAVLASA